MKKLVSVLVLVAMLLGCVSALADSLLPYDGEAVTYQGYTADLGPPAPGRTLTPRPRCS